MKLISSTFFIYKDDYFLMRNFFEKEFKELAQNKDERTSQHSKRLRKLFAEAFIDVEKNTESKIFDDLVKSLAKLFGKQDDTTNCNNEVHHKDFKDAFIKGDLKRLELQLYRYAYNDYQKSSIISKNAIILFQKIIEKHFLSEIEDISANHFFTTFKDFLNVKEDCPYGLYLQIRECKKISCEDKLSGLFKDKARALYILGQMYYYGDFIEQNYTKAFDCFEQAKELGNIHAQEYLAWMYFYGEGTEKNYEKAIMLQNEFEYSLLLDNSLNIKTTCNLKKAVEENVAEEQIKLGRYFTIRGRKQDYEKAIEWYKKATEQGFLNAMAHIGYIYHKEKNDTKAMQWYLKAAEQGSSDIQYIVGWKYAQGSGIEKDSSKAMEWFKKAANSNNSAAQYEIGYMYFCGNGVEQSNDKAIEWFEIAAKNGNKQALSFLNNEKIYRLPIMHAAKINSIDKITALINEGVDINIKKNGKTPLMIAAQFNSIDVAKMLIKAGANFDAKDEQGKTALMIAAQYDSNEIAKILIENGADETLTDKNDKTPLMIAAVHNSINTAKLLIDSGSEINVKPHTEIEKIHYEYQRIINKKTPLMLAAINNAVDVAKLLIEKGAEINVRVVVKEKPNKLYTSCDRKITAFEFAVRNNATDVIKLFLEMGIATSNTALVYAARYNSIEIAKLAIEYGAEIDKTLIDVVKEESVNVVKFLIDSGAYCGKTALKYAISQNLVAISKLLIDAGAELNQEVDNDNKQHWKKTDIQFEFHPKNEAVFKQLFILVGQANRYFYLNGKDEPVKNTWTMRSFSMDSNLKACIFSSTCYRENLPKGINKIRLEIPFCEKYENYSLDQVNNEIDDIRQHIFEEKQKKINLNFNFESSRITKNTEESFPLPISASMEKEQQNSTSQTLTIEEEYKIVCEFYKEGLYEKAFKHFSNLAEEGYPLAQKSLADMYFKGEGTEKNLAKALEWYEKAAEQGNDSAQFSLGLFFFCGNGVIQDYAEAKKWFEKASAQNNTSATYFLSCMYYNGDGTEKDRQKAQWLFEKARETCNEQKIMKLDKLYYEYRNKNATLNIPIEAKNNELTQKKKVVIIKKKKVL